MCMNEAVRGWMDNRPITCLAIYIVALTIILCRMTFSAISVVPRYLLLIPHFVTRLCSQVGAGDGDVPIKCAACLF